MKKSITFIICFLWIGAMYGQLDYTLEPSVAYAEDRADVDDFFAHTMIKNLSAETIVIAWQRIENDLPTNWESYICSNITCAPPDVSMGTFSLTANDSTNLDCHFTPEGNSGQGIVELRLFLTHDTTQVIHATYFGNIAPVATHQSIREQIKIYPNPVLHDLQIDHTQQTRVELFNSSGQLLSVFYHQSRLDLQSIATGNYFLKIYNDQNQLISINHFYKMTTK